MLRQLTFAIISLLMTASFSFAQNIKTPNVSGQFYEADPKKLSASVEHYLRKADLPTISEDVAMIIAPHAGYVYSGPVAGYSFKAVSGKTFKTIVILAPSHYFGFDGASIWAKGAFKTPLGDVPVDENFTAQLLAADPKFTFDPSVYEREHSLEVEIPFLQKTFSNFQIVPVILGQMSPEACLKLAKALNAIIKDRQDVLIVVSSDMSHYHDGKTAQAMDASTLETIKQLDAAGLYTNCGRRKQEMCGFIPVTTALLLAKQRNWQPRVLKYSHSGDVTGDNSRVVGYGAVAFVKTKDQESASSTQRPSFDVQRPMSSVQRPLNKDQQKQLIALAKQTIEQFVRTKKVYEVKPLDARLAEPEGAFVTIHKNGALRGCIGHIVTDEPLYKTVRDMAIAAVSEDPRFPPVNEKELSSLEIEISVLSRPWAVKNVSEIVMGTHGVILGQGMRRGVFLPQVATETGWSKEEFLSQLCSQKAGLKPDCWKDPNVKIEIFTADVFSEKDID